MDGIIRREASPAAVAIGHSWDVRLGFDWRTIGLGVLAVALAAGLGAAGAILAGALGGALGALAGLAPPAVLAVAAGRRARNAARLTRRQEILRKFAPPGPSRDGDGR